MSDPLQLVLSRLAPHGLRPAGRDRWSSVGVCHGGSNPSTLAVALGDHGHVLLRCHKGCSITRIVDSIGLDMSDLFPRRPVGNASLQYRSAPSILRQFVGMDADANRKREQAAEIVRQSNAFGATGSLPPFEYLAHRHCSAVPSGSDLRWLPDLRLFGFSGPALVGRLSPAEDCRELRGAHLTWLRRGVDGSWNRWERRYLGAKAGCVVRLWPDCEVRTGLGIAEGIETALSLAHAGLPVWAACDAGNLSAFPALDGIEALTIAADNDAAGIAAAEACAQRWAMAGREVRVVTPAQEGTDLNDLARAT